MPFARLPWKNPGLCDIHSLMDKSLTLSSMLSLIERTDTALPDDILAALGRAYVREQEGSIARETLEIYAPIAHRLGMGRMKAELEDLALAFQHPEEHRRLTEQLRQLPFVRKVLRGDSDTGVDMGELNREQAQSGPRR